MAEPSRKRKRQEENEGENDAATDGETPRHSGKRACQGMRSFWEADMQLHFVRGEKQHIFDDKGHKYLDTMNSVQHVGHCHPTVVAAGAAQMAELNTNTRFLNDRMITYAQKLTATLPEKLSVCFFVNSGSEANDLALRIAEVISGGSQCISLSGCYHGHLKSLRALTDTTYSTSSSDATPPHVSESPGLSLVSPPTEKSSTSQLKTPSKSSLSVESFASSPASDSCIAPRPDMYRGQYRDPETAGEQYTGQIQKIIDCQKSQNRRIASFIHESVMCHAGVIYFPKGFLQAAYKSVHDAGGLCIADEGGCGFGRTGKKFWGFELQGVCPDIVTLGKPMGNGHPVAAVITSREIADKFALGCDYFNTFGGNPVSMAIAQSVLRVVEEEGLQENAHQLGVYLVEQLRQLQEKHTCIGDVRGMGLLIGIEFVTDRETRELASAKAKEILVRLLEDHQIVSVVDDIHGNVLKVQPPLCFSMDNARELVSALDAVLSKVCQ